MSAAGSPVSRDAAPVSRRQMLSLAGLPWAAALAACTGESGRPLRIGAQVFPGYEFLFLARREGWTAPEAPNRPAAVEQADAGPATTPPAGDAKQEG